MSMKIVIDHKVHQKIMHWVNKSHYEVSGFGNVVLEKDGVFRVISAVLTKQQNSSAETDIKAEDVAKALFETRDTEGEMRWWWHSHVNMAVFWSNTDHQAMRDFASQPESWMICTVFNKKNELRSAYFAPQGCETPWGKSVLMFDELPTSITAANMDEVAQWDAEYEAKVTNGYSYKHHWNNSSGTQVQGLADKRPAAQRPPGISKRDWKKLKKQEADLKKTVDGIVNEAVKKDEGNTKTESRFNVDEYGLDQTERQLLATNGWDIKDVDTLFQRGFNARQIAMIAEADYHALDIVNMLDVDKATLIEVMMEVSDILRIRRSVEASNEPTTTASDDGVEIDDDIPVADRKSKVIDMRHGYDSDLYGYPGEHCGY